MTSIACGMQYKGLQCQPCCGDGEHQAAARDLNMIKVHQGVTRDEILKGQLFILFSMNRTISFFGNFLFAHRNLGDTRSPSLGHSQLPIDKNFLVPQT
jgi:hypothetical protein